MSLKSGKSATSSNSNNDSSYVEPEFVLKHRVVGAAFLLFFGALFLPWVLGAPGEEKQTSTKNQSNGGQNSNGRSQSSASRPVADNASNSSSVDELAAAIAGEEVDTEEQVYISKITPLDATSGAASELGKAIENQDDVSVSTQAEVAAKQAEVKPELKPKASTANVKNTTKPSSNESAKPNPATQLASNAVKPETSSTTVAANSVKPEAVKSAAIEVGWIVQVGVFTDKRGAGKVVDDLRNKGFQPSTTIVDTNRGPASGTRIWLGPFSQRVNAAKAKAELTSKTGEAGFIRAYP